jgi:phosphatidylinositol alpha-mannosyltransferase
MALIEGMAAGRAVVAYDIEGVRELVTDGREGYKVPVGDVDALADALCNVLADDAHRRVMARMSRTRAAAFDWAQVAKRIEDVYYELTGDSAVPKPVSDAPFVPSPLREVL